MPRHHARPRHLALFGTASFVLGLVLAYWFVGAAVLNTPICGVLHPPPGCRTIEHGVWASYVALAAAPLSWLAAFVWALVDLRRPIRP